MSEFSPDSLPPWFASLAARHLSAVSKTEAARATLWLRTHIRTPSAATALVAHAIERKWSYLLARAYADCLRPGPLSKSKVPKEELLSHIPLDAISRAIAPILSEAPKPVLDEQIAHRLANHSNPRHFNPSANFLEHFTEEAVIILLSSPQFRSCRGVFLPPPALFKRVLNQLSPDAAPDFISWFRDKPENIHPHARENLAILIEHLLASPPHTPLDQIHMYDLAEILTSANTRHYADLMRHANAICIIYWLTRTSIIRPVLYQGDAFSKDDIDFFVSRLRALPPHSYFKELHADATPACVNALESRSVQEREYLLLTLPGLAQEVLAHAAPNSKCLDYTSRLLHSSRDEAFSRQILDIHTSASLKDALDAAALGASPLQKR